MITADPYALLGVAPTASVAEIVAACEHLLVIFDPERWAGTPDLSRQAGEWAEAIEAAAAAILDR
ncbi:MAG: hypothetical protein R6X23_03225 [Acidimicrobiia bacterium]